ncbi:Alpha-L-arabinofuranosidase C-terminus [Rhizoctonia solani]|uniref:non-reducing end alpha-L-arabinofuranosidase n=1 Tax=Rhizoctonia solani TaxID=456999 RepID=A0A8H7GZU5_9AGAM|nr:Alpha-L-arabinofuranosidase C-terminus [Rhizoctonia solani]
MGPFYRLFVLALTAGAFAQSSLRIQVTNTQTHAIPSTMYGWMWEDINHSGDGGLYAELLQNRAFQAVTANTPQALNAWSAYRGTSLSVINSIPGVSNALRNSLQAKIPAGASGQVGFDNSGYWGIKVQSGWKYTGSFYARSDSYTGSVTVSLASSSGTTYATATVSGVTNSWKKFTFDFTPSQSAPDVKNVFRVTVDGASASGKSVYFGMFSLFPPTYKGRQNGMRIDLAETLAASKPRVWRFPGGNNLEGQTVAKRWKWNETIGPIENRPGRQGDWGYANTDGLGLIEYLNWAEDIGAEPILAHQLYYTPAGYSLGGETVPESQLQPYVQDAINEIQFITGDANTNQWAKLRAQYGRTAPYKLRYIEIGNEDFAASASYAQYRWRVFVNGLKAAFPNSGFQYIATTYPSTTLSPAYTHIDWHQYNVPKWFIDHALEYDTYPRNGAQVFVGEYAVTSTNPSCIFGPPSCGRLEYPTLQGAVAEAAYMTGLERNSDVVFASTYAPTLQNINGHQWTPDVITFDAGSMVKSASYYAQQMFGSNMGTHVLKTSPAPSASVPLHWVASHDAANKIVYLKASNTGTSSFTGTFALDFPITGQSTTTLLTAGAPGTFNTLSNPNAVVPQTSNLNVGSGATSFTYNFPPQSVAVFKLPVGW